jgi:hypothetical protein
MEPVEGRCPVKTAKGSICGAALKEGQPTCKKHASAAAVEPEPEPEPDVDMIVEEEEQKSPEEIRLEEEPELVIPDPEPEPLQPPIESDLFHRPEWTMHYVDDSATMLRTLQDIQVVDLDARQWEQLELKIRACFE